MNGTKLHVALVRGEYAEAILAGRKVAEARLSRHRRDPFDRVTPGERVYFKRVGGDYFATAVVDAVAQMSGLRPEDIPAIRDVWDHEVLGGDEFWNAKSAAKYATMTHFCNVERVYSGPRLSMVYPRGSRSAWHVLPESMCVYPECLDPVLIPVDGEAKRQRRVVPAHAGDEELAPGVWKIGRQGSAPVRHRSTG